MKLTIPYYLHKAGAGFPSPATDYIEEDIDRLKGKGYQFLSDGPSIGAHNAKVIFIHPKSCDGVLIELNQPSDEQH